MKYILHILVIFVLFCSFMLLMTSCSHNNYLYMDRAGYWTNEDGSIILDYINNFAKIYDAKNNESYYLELGWQVGDYGSNYLHNSYESYIPRQNSIGLLIQLLLQPDNGANALTATIDSDELFSLEGKTITLQFIPSEQAPNNALTNIYTWCNDENNSTFDFGNDEWNCKVDEVEYKGDISVFQAEEVLRVKAKPQIGTDIEIHNSMEVSSFLAKVTTKTDNEITLTILTADGIFASQVGENITITKQVK